MALAWSLAGLYFLNRGMWAVAMPGDAALTTGLEFCRREIERQRDLLRRVLLWSFGPIMLAIGTLILALTMVGMRARTGPGVAQLSAFAQSTGYLISIPGPLLVGVLYQSSGGWGVPLALMAGLLVPQTVVGYLAGRDRTVEDEAAR